MRWYLIGARRFSRLDGNLLASGDKSPCAKKNLAGILGGKLTITFLLEKRTIFKRTHPIWRQKQIRHTYSTTIGYRRQTLHPAGVRQIPPPRKSSRQHTTMYNQRHHFPICKTNQIHLDTNTAIPLLCSNTRRHRHHLQHKQYETSHTQRCKLP